MNSSTSESINSSNINVDSNIPKIPMSRKGYDDWRFMMECYLDVRGLKGLLYDSSNIPPLNDTKTISSDTIIKKDDKNESASSTTTPVPSSSSNTITYTDYQRKRTYNILIQSLNSKQIKIIKHIKNLNIYLVWKKLKDTYGIIRTQSNEQSLIKQLNDIIKEKKESMEDYIARIDNHVYDLESLGTNTSLAMHKYYIMNGLSKIDEWKFICEYIRTSDVKNNMPMDELHCHLINADNNKRIDNIVDEQVIIMTMK
jgi:hypothetical protein